jgi:hypothetical protein
VFTMLAVLSTVRLLSRRPEGVAYLPPASLRS